MAAEFAYPLEGALLQAIAACSEQERRCAQARARLERAQARRRYLIKVLRAARASFQLATAERTREFAAGRWSFLSLLDERVRAEAAAEREAAVSYGIARQASRDQRRELEDDLAQLGRMAFDVEQWRKRRAEAELEFHREKQRIEELQVQDDALRSHNRRMEGPP